MNVLHIVSSLNPGGIEKWLSDLVEVDNCNQHSFLKQKKETGFLENSITGNGGVIHLLENRFILSYLFQLYFFLRRHDYDVVHSHVHLSSGAIMFICFLAGVKIRVTHSHLDDRAHNVSSPGYYNILMKMFIKIFSNRLIACSNGASVCLFEDSNGVLVMPCGIKLNSKLDVDYAFEVRNRLEICHVGRFSKEKNHEFIIRFVQALDLCNVNFQLSLVGSGESKKTIEAMVDSYGLNDKVKFVGNLTSVDSFMVDKDLFIFPSLHEGLGLALVEAQFYGLYCICSDSIPSEAIYQNCLPLQINGDAEFAWVEAVKLLLSEGVLLENPREEILSSEVNVSKNVKSLISFYKCGYR
ncbi:conserved hypothetical protein [Vibrio chagasii]|nr:conserved hypothetical protein [Vibrio chagasii]